MQDTKLDIAGSRWQQLAQQTAFRLRVASIFQQSVPAAAVAGLLLLGLGIVLRIYAPERMWIVAIVAGALAVGFMSVLLRAKRSTHKVSILAGFTRLDSTLGLHNALSVAASGQGPWPALPAKADDLLRFNWKRILPPYGLAALLVVAGLLIPLPGEALAAGRIPPPRSHEELAALISEMEKLEALKKADIEKLQQQLDEIRNEPAENWYRHSSLEAADHLQNGIQEQMRALERGLNQAVSSIEALEKLDESTSSAGQQRLAEEFKSALQGLKNTSPGLNQNLMESLSAIDPTQLKSLNSGDLHKMLEQMKAAANGCKNCQGEGQGGRREGDGGALSELEALLGSGESSGQGQQSGDGPPNSGGIQRGPGVAALPLSRNPTDLATDKPEYLQTDDFRRARPGDAIGSSDTEHNLDKDPVKRQTGGGAAAGLGGEAVSRDTLLPAEKAILRSYFR